MSGAKVWGQKTADGRFAMVYNPVNDSLRRYPLAIVTGDDGIHFDDLLYIAAISRRGDSRQSQGFRLAIRARNRGRKRNAARQ